MLTYFSSNLITYVNLTLKKTWAIMPMQTINWVNRRNPVLIFIDSVFEESLLFCVGV